MKLSNTQNNVVELLKKGYTINYFRGIGTRFAPSATLEHNDCISSKTVSVATVKALRKYNLLEEVYRESYHSRYRLKLTN